MKKKFKIYRALKILIALSTFVFTLVVIFMCITIHKLKYEIPQIMSIELYDANNVKYLSYSNSKKKSYVKLNNISPYLKKAFICIEDKRFYDHHGLDIIRVFGAFFANLKSGKIKEGGSTITQQYVKTLFLDNSKKWERKFNEALISIKFESLYSKDEILEGYLNAIYFDHGIYGVEDASLFYFGKHASELSLKESATLASIPKGPSIYSPLKNPKNNSERTLLILDEMQNDKVITKDEYLKAKNEKIKLIGVNLNNEAINAPFFQDLVLDELNMRPDILKEAYKGLKIYTTLDSDLYKSMSASIQKRKPNDEIEIALYAIDPTTGDVLSVVGGQDYNESTYNRATKSRRQAGSVIKPFLYLSALQNGFTPATTFKSEQTTFYINGISYSPNNFGKVYPNTDVSMLYALATSDNIYAVKTHLFLGTNEFSKTLKTFGFENTPTNLPSLALGVNDISLKELTEAYSILANCGAKANYSTIKKIETFDGDILYEKKENTKQLVNESDVFILNETMTSVFNNNLQFLTRPTGAIISSKLNHKYAGKTGSTDFDNWIVGFNKDIVLGVWTGYDDNIEIKKSSESRFCKYVFADVIESYSKNKGSWYEMPSDVISINLNPLTGFYPAIDEDYIPMYFKKSNIPWYIKLLYGN